MKIPHVPSAAFRLGAFATLAAVIVLIFPRYNNAFRFHYEIGKPWGYSTLTADFDFPIYKTDEQMDRDQKQLLSTFAPIFKYIPRVQREVRVISLAHMEWLQAEGYSRITIGKDKYPVSDIFTPKTAFTRYGYDCAINLTLDTAKTEDLRDKLLQSISPTQGLVQKGEKIIDKGEVVTERTYQILNSLRRAYEDESIGHKQRTLSVFGEAMLVVLFLCLLVIYLYVFRLNYLQSTSTVLFYCLQIFIVIALACLALRFNLSVYLIPFAWVPILTRVFPLPAYPHYPHRLNCGSGAGGVLLHPDSGWNGGCLVSLGYDAPRTTRPDSRLDSPFASSLLYRYHVCPNGRYHGNRSLDVFLFLHLRTPYCRLLRTDLYF